MSQEVETQPLVQEPFSSSAVEEKSTGCEDANKCLMCFPLGCGLKTLGVLHIIGTITMAGMAAVLTEVDTTAGAIMFVGLSPMITAAYFYIRYLGDSENVMRRQHLKYAIWATFVTCIII